MTAEVIQIDKFMHCVRCLECGIAWGYGREKEELKQWAREHNELRHSGPRRSI